MMFHWLPKSVTHEEIYAFMQRAYPPEYLYDPELAEKLVVPIYRKTRVERLAHKLARERKEAIATILENCKDVEHSYDSWDVYNGPQWEETRDALKVLGVKEEEMGDD